jgi:hypothetical protein
MAELSGTVLHRGEPQAGCQVLAIDEQARAVLADASTGADGAWSLKVPDGQSQLLAFARCRGEALGIVGRRTPPGATGVALELTAVAPTHRLSVRVEGEGLPGGAIPQVELMPLRVGDYGGEMLRWITAPVREMSSGVLARLAAERDAGGEPSVQRMAQAGRWWLTAGYAESAEARSVGMPAGIVWRAVSAQGSDGRELPALHRGFELELEGPQVVTIRLEREVR